MIFTTLKTIAYRVHTPKWAYSLTSGAGASMHGGRANRPGIQALYLSLELETALAEYKQVRLHWRWRLLISINAPFLS